MLSERKKVLVTGASGFVALHCISQLLKRGFKVKGSLRDLKKENEVRKALKENLNKDNFEVCKLDLLKDDGWDKAISNCQYLMHIASPCILKEPKNEKYIIDSAVKGTLRALKAAHKYKIQKVILTSSIGSIIYGHNKDFSNSNDWTDISIPVGTYIKSKTLAEKTAWDFIKSLNNPSFSMTSINPGMIFGPLLNDRIKGTSASLILKTINGEYPALPNIYFSVVDVRDVAKIHVESIFNNKCKDKRIIVSSSKSISFLEISAILRKLGYEKSTSRLVPDQLIKILSIINKDMRITATMIKRGCFSLDISEWPNGFYLVKFDIDSKQIVKHFIKY